MPRPRPSRSAYAVFETLTTRWNDNDVYGHMNNVVYYEYVDTTVTLWLRNSADMPVPATPIVGLVVETTCTYHASLGWPTPIEAGLCVKRIGKSSITYGVGLFESGNDACAGEALFTHVYVDAETRRPVEIPENLRLAAQKILKEN